MRESRGVVGLACWRLIACVVVENGVLFSLLSVALKATATLQAISLSLSLTSPSQPSQAKAKSSHALATASYYHITLLP